MGKVEPRTYTHKDCDSGNGIVIKKGSGWECQSCKAASASRNTLTREFPKTKPGKAKKPLKGRIPF
jgi:hypothetical protein